MLNTRALPHAPSSSRLPDTEPAAHGSTGTPTSTTPSPTDALPSRRSQGPSAPRRAPPSTSAESTRALASAARQPGISARVAEMKTYLADLRAHHAAERELPGIRSHDAKFLDLLVAAEGDRDPSLKLSAQSIDYKGLRQGGAAAMKAVDGLARAAISDMQQGSWHAVVSVDGHQVALSAQHDAQHAGRLSLVVVDSVGESLSAQEWNQVAMLMREHMNRALTAQGKPADAQVWLSSLNTSVQKTNEGSAIFALAAVREMPKDGDVQGVHAEQLRRQAAEPQHPAGARLRNDNAQLGARFFKHMTLEANMKVLLEKRPELADAPVNKKGQTLPEYQAAHLSRHVSRIGTSHQTSGSYEKRRLRMYERLVDRLETTVASQQLAGQIGDMKAYVHELKRAAKGKTTLPVSREADFLKLLVGVENTLDPQLRLRAHSLDVAKVVAGDQAATDDLWHSLAEGVRTGADWHATLDIAGHHAALSAKHDPADTSIMSLVVIDGAGSPMDLEDWETLAALLCRRLHREQAETDDDRMGKVWLMRLNTAAIPPGPDGALFALTAATEMKGAPSIGETHAQALAQANESQDFDMAWERDAGELSDVDDGPTDGGHLLADPGVQQERIDLYQRAIGYYERSVG
jgi:hypothetical protein